MAPVETLKRLFIENNRKRFPALPDSCRIVPSYSDSTAAGLAQMIAHWLLFHGHPAEKRIITEPKLRMDGSRYITSRIRETYTVIEVWTATDPMTETQKSLQKRVLDSEGTYVLARTFDQFVFWYQNFVA